MPIDLTDNELAAIIAIAAAVWLITCVGWRPIIC
jgi:hypothetical protein